MRETFRLDYCFNNIRISYPAEIDLLPSFGAMAKRRSHASEAVRNALLFLIKRENNISWSLRFYHDFLCQELQRKQRALSPNPQPAATLAANGWHAGTAPTRHPCRTTRIVLSLTMTGAIHFDSVRVEWRLEQPGNIRVIPPRILQN